MVKMCTVPNSPTWAIVIVFLALIGTPAYSISCANAMAKLFPCQTFLKGSGANSAPCCAGLKSLQELASSESSTRFICRCLKQAISTGLSDSMLENAKLLPQLCKINFPLVFDPAMNCNKFGMAYESLNWNSYYNVKETSPGRSPGMGHDTPPPGREKTN
ncbi:non-specific lipid-transfer protein 1-like [Coffea eugenioides]|uniref:non-specific lipid-transfer protein 1-like n=1 Tax=Coffea eugenioides TaxID=49369 RepID=UPI000F5C94E3|nr:non-specific lipid-transfer protein 1-like [Coffea arabica]XP_027150589.1 non-specific lipid-transfer protein 1-like [Coffea eugenioides]XP_027150591.1 non-specific lipid-transfer protein 1-like [Coffea eugenioides]